jgi:hypothetical protein
MFAIGAPNDTSIESKAGRRVERRTENSWKKTTGYAGSYIDIPDIWSRNGWRRPVALGSSRPTGQLLGKNSDRPRIKRA